jgi:hypothetical protein
MGNPKDISVKLTVQNLLAFMGSVWAGGYIQTRARKRNTRHALKGYFLRTNGIIFGLFVMAKKYKLISMATSWQIQVTSRTSPDISAFSITAKEELYVFEIFGHGIIVTRLLSLDQNGLSPHFQFL